MSGPTLIGIVLIAFGVVDFGVGMLLVVPRAPESSQAVLRLVFGIGAVLMIVLGALFLAGAIGGGA